MDAAVTQVNAAKSKVDIRDHRQIGKELDVGTISADTVSRMMRFLGIESNDNLVEQRLNKQRIEHQKTVPMTKK
jgi:hypothetical protein